MFDSTLPVKVNVQTEEGLVHLSLRWPTDDEWDERMLDRKIFIKRLGRGITETTIDAVPGDVKLYERIKMNGAPSLTEAEAARVIEKMALCDVTEVQVTANEAEVEMSIPSGIVKHRLRIPTAEQALKLTRSTHVYTLPYNLQRMKIGIATSAAIYDAQGGKSDGYTGAIPALHKDAAVRAVIDYVDNQMGAGEDEKFF